MFEEVSRINAKVSDTVFRAPRPVAGTGARAQLSLKALAEDS